MGNLLSRLPQTLRHALILALAVLLGVAAYRAWGWGGLALVSGAAFMWVLLHANRVLLVLRRAARQPIGSVTSATMLHARLSPGMPLLEVMALSGALGERVATEDTALEVYRWTDSGQDNVLAHFEQGRLVHWQLVRS